MLVLLTDLYYSAQHLSPSGTQRYVLSEQMKPTATSASTTTFLCYYDEELTDCYHYKLMVSGSAPRAVGQHPGCCGDSQGTPPSQYFLPFFLNSVLLLLSSLMDVEIPGLGHSSSLANSQSITCYIVLSLAR